MSQRVVHNMVLQALHQDDNNQDLSEIDYREKRFLEELEAKQEVYDTLEEVEDNSFQEANMEFFGDGEAQQMQNATNEEDEMDISTEILIMIFLLMLAITFGHFLKKSGHKYLQESGLTVILGMVAGGILKMLSVEDYLTKLSTHFSNLFMILLLPPIIFESGYNMNKKPFFRNFGTVLAYSFLGTFIAIFTSSVLFYYVGQTGMSPDFTWKDSFAFGSLISATDPVSVLAIFKELDANENLYAIVFGESIFNDAISIVMYETVIMAGTGDKTISQEIFGSLAQFILVFVGSLMIGAVSALLIAFILKRQASYIREQNQTDHKMTDRQQTNAAKQNVLTEISLMILCPWVSYLIAEGLKLSGIVAILTNGIFLSYYATPNISPAAKKVLQLCYETIAISAEQIVFLFLGIGLFAFNHPYDQMGWGLVLTTVINLNLARFLNVFIVSSLVNCQRTDSKLDSKFQTTMWFSGLRGAMAYALALKSVTDLAIGPVILIDTLLYALFTILGIGSIMNPVLERLGVKNTEESRDASARNDLVENAREESDNDRPKNCSSKIKKKIRNFDNEYFSPLFIKDVKNIQRRNLADSFAETPVHSLNRNSFAFQQRQSISGQWGANEKQFTGESISAPQSQSARSKQNDDVVDEGIFSRNTQLNSKNSSDQLSENGDDNDRLGRKPDINEL